MSDADRDNILAGLYRRVGKLCDEVERLTALLARYGATAPLPPKDGDALAPTLPGFPDEAWTPPDVTPPPRAWSNAVRSRPTPASSPRSSRRTRRNGTGATTRS